MTDGPLLTKSMQRCLANDPRQRASVMNDVEDVFDPNIPFSKKPNAKYGPAVLLANSRDFTRHAFFVPRCRQVYDFTADI